MISKDFRNDRPKTTRIRIEVSFTSQTEGVILLKDMGFGEMFPGNRKDYRLSVYIDFVIWSDFLTRSREFS